MKRTIIGAGAAIATVATVALVASAQPSNDKAAAGKKAFLDVARVLQSPRCMNCHPSGDRPLQTDAGKPHAQNISRASIAAGLLCSTCHGQRNADDIGVAGGPPGAPNWNLPPADMPLVFQGRTPAQLCAQLKDPAQNGHRTLAQVAEHIAHDPLVAWGWHPGGKRTLPPLTHDQMNAAVAAWVESEGACPE